MFSKRHQYWGGGGGGGGTIHVYGYEYNHQALWDLIEHSESSKAAEIVSIISTAFVGVSIVGMTVNTMPDLQYTVILIFGWVVINHTVVYNFIAKIIVKTTFI